MNNNLDLKLLKYQHEAIMAKRNISNEKINHEALAPLFRYAVYNKDIDIIAKMHKEFIMQIMLESRNVKNVDDISDNLIINQLDNLIISIKNKL